MTLLGSFGSREAGVATAVTGILLYLNSLDCGLVYDDEDAISWNRDLRPSTPWSFLLVHDFWGTPLVSQLSHKSYRPLCVATFRLNYLWHGLAPMGYHVVNVGLHAVVCYLYVQLCVLIFKNIWPALLAGLLFASHPIHTEAVTGVVGRAELLSSIFFLTSFLLYHKALHSKSKVQGSVSWRPLVLSLLTGLCAMLCKEQGITVFGLCLAYDICIVSQVSMGIIFKHATHSSSGSQKAKNFFVRGVVVSTTALVALIMRLCLANGAPNNKAFASSSNPPLMQETPLRQLSWLHLLHINTKLLFFPSSLTADWRYGSAPIIEAICDWNNALTVVTLLSLGGLIVNSLTQQNKAQSRICIMGICLTVIPFLPASNLFFPVGFVVAERVLYLPSMGFCLLAAYGFSLVYRKSIKWHWANMLVKLMIGWLLIFYSAKTLRRNRDWLNGMAINRAGVQLNPRHAIMLSNLGIEHALKEDYKKAEILYWSGMHSYPYFSGAFHNYGLLMNILHRYEEAEEPLRKAIEYGSTDTRVSKMMESYSLLSTVIATNSSRLKEALELSNYVLRGYPEHSECLHTKCSILLQLNRTGDFVYTCEKALWYNQRDPAAFYNLGVAYSRLGYLSDAENILRKMLKTDSSSAMGKSLLANVLLGTGKKQDIIEARQLLTQVLVQEPNNQEALLKLSYVESELQHKQLALKSLQKLLQVNPLHHEALYQTSQLHFKMQDYDNARKTVSHLINLEPDHLNALSLLKKINTFLNTRSTS